MTATVSKGKPLPDPPYPATTAAKGFTFALDYPRIVASDTWALAPQELRPWLLMLWFTAWQQIPAGAFVDDDALIAARIGMPAKAFKAHRATLLRRWYRARDGRIYQPVIVAMMRERIEWRDKEAERKKQWRLSQGTNAGQTQDSTVRDDTGAGAGAGALDSTPPTPPRLVTPTPTAVQNKTGGNEKPNGKPPNGGGEGSADGQGIKPPAGKAKPQAYKRVPSFSDQRGLEEHCRGLGLDPLKFHSYVEMQSACIAEGARQRAVAKGVR